MSKYRLNTVYFILLLAPLFWGGAFGVTKHVLTELTPLTASAIRFLLASLLMITWVTIRKEWKFDLIKQHWLGLTLLGFTGVFLYNFFFATGLQYTSAINGALIFSVNPAVTACMAIILLGETWNWRIGVGVIISFIGVFLIVTQGNLHILENNSICLGDIYILGSVISWVSYTLLGRLITCHIGPLLTTTISTFLGSLMLLFASFFAEHNWEKILTISKQTTFEFAYLAIFATVVAFLSYNWGVQQIGATKASSYINLMPINALWIAILFYGESASINHFIGMIITIIGVLVTIKSQQLTSEKASANKEAPPLQIVK